jgi:hypothetical protein
LFSDLQTGGKAAVLYEGVEYPVRVLEVDGSSAEVEYENGETSILHRADAGKRLLSVEKTEKRKQPQVRFKFTASNFFEGR